MASCCSLLSEEQPLCCLCEGVLANPISTTCGHTFCKICITIKWLASEHMNCPRCQESFFGKHEQGLSQETRNFMENFKKKELERKEEERVSDESSATQREVPCNVCQGTKLRAHKSCVDICQLSFCQTHLEPHQKDPDLITHKLTNPVFFCCYCDEVLTDPISTTCGHPFCNICITSSWAATKQIQCPLCQKPFNGIPPDQKSRDVMVELIRNRGRGRNISDVNNWDFWESVADLISWSLQFVSLDGHDSKPVKKGPRRDSEDKLERMQQRYTN